MIEIKHLSKTFSTRKNEVHALKDIDITIDRGDIFGIIGISGAGKSTLLRCLSGLETPTGGDIAIEGRSIIGIKGSELTRIRREMGVVFQGYNLLMQKTVAENIAFPLRINGYSKQDIDSRVKELLKIVDLEDKWKSYPSQLSGGQKQRVAIARALATQPKILLCDEPTSALDPLTTKQVLGLLQEINEKLSVTVIIITHEIGVVRRICNRLAVIAEGTIAESGDVKEVFASPKAEATRLLLGYEE